MTRRRQKNTKSYSTPKITEPFKFPVMLAIQRQLFRKSFAKQPAFKNLTVVSVDQQPCLKRTPTRVLTDFTSGALIVRNSCAQVLADYVLTPCADCKKNIPRTDAHAYILAQISESHI